MSESTLPTTKSPILDNKASLLRSILDKYGWLVKRLIKFGLVGASGFLVDMGTYLLLSTMLGIPHLIARGGSYWVSATWNWFWNRYFTFSHVEKTQKLPQWTKYLGMCVISFIPNWGSYYALTTYISFFSDYKQLALIAGVGFGMFFNFTIASLYIFSEKKNSPPKEI